MINILKKNNTGFVALIFVIMITSIFIVSSVIIAMVNTSNNMANYHAQESDDVMYNLDACLSDAMWQIASTTNASGDYSIAVDGVNCAYQISATVAGMKTVTSTATTTSDVGSWNRSVVMRVNVSSSPFFIQSHKDYIAGTCLNNSCCGDAICNATETCGTCGTDCGACPVCGNGIPEVGEACDDGDVETESCGNTTTESGNFCNTNCSAILVLSEQCDDGNALNTDACLNNCMNASCGDGYKQTGVETCDYESLDCPSGTAGTAVGCTSRPYCNEFCSACLTSCPAM